MHIDRKSVMEEVVRDYLEAEAPDLLDEFRVVYDDVYESIERIETEDGGSDRGRSEDGIGLVAGMICGTVISAACWIAAELLKAGLKDSVEHDLIPRLDQAEHVLAEWTKDTLRVHKIRERVERVLRRWIES